MTQQFGEQASASQASPAVCPEQAEAVCPEQAEALYPNSASALCSTSAEALNPKPTEALTVTYKPINGLQHHGGRLGEAAEKYGRPRDQWLDLSTGINPQTWPIPDIPIECWQRLPEDDDGLELAAKTYYGCETLLPVAGSQAAIQTLPRLRPASRVAIIDPGYNEHRAAWTNNGHHVIDISANMIESIIEDIDVLVVINPNNPGADQFASNELLRWHKQLSERGGWLLVDEAFIDSTPELSIASLPTQKGLIVLRSVGKFFGLAGIRCGFVISEPTLLAQLEQLLGPWTLTGPSRFICRQALLDTEWQRQMRAELARHAHRLRKILAQHLELNVQGTYLFQCVYTTKAEEYHRQLAHQGILTRLFPAPQLLRFGLPNGEDQWQRLEVALSNILEHAAGPTTTTCSK